MDQDRQELAKVEQVFDVKKVWDQAKIRWQEIRKESNSVEEEAIPVQMMLLGYESLRRRFLEGTLSMEICHIAYDLNRALMDQEKIAGEIEEGEKKNVLLDDQEDEKDNRNEPFQDALIQLKTRFLQEEIKKNKLEKQLEHKIMRRSEIQGAFDTTYRALEQETLKIRESQVRLANELLEIKKVLKKCKLLRENKLQE